MIWRKLFLLGFFVGIAVIQRLMESPAPGYFAMFAGLATVAVVNSGIKAAPAWFPGMTWAAVVWCLVTLLVTATTEARPEIRDVLRDVGAICAFFVGRFLLVGSLGLRQEERVLQTISDLGVIVAALTIAAAVTALLAGADAYHWRGVYVPFVHTWLPYSMAASFAMATHTSWKAHGWKVVLCIVGSMASLSRTDLLLELMFVLWALLTRARNDSHRRAALAQLVLVLVCIGALLPSFLQLTVVQERLEAGVGEEDLSVSWRVIENQAFFDTMEAADSVDWLVGRGLGARVDLPDGVLDFNGNPSIPHLHNSFLTIALKFGAGGLLLFVVWLCMVFIRPFRHLAPARSHLRMAGAWIVLFVLGKAVTLQGLTDWTHVMFFGLGCGLLLAASLRPSRRQSYLSEKAA